jgi:hypothetical protein
VFQFWRSEEESERTALPRDKERVGGTSSSPVAVTPIYGREKYVQGEPEAVSTAGVVQASASQ